MNVSIPQPGSHDYDYTLNFRLSQILMELNQKILRTENAAWNGAHLIMGGHHIWIDATGAPRIKSSAPTSDLDGSLIGASATESFIIACSDETTALSAGTAKVTFRMPYAFTVTSVKASLTTAQTSGNIFTVDINDSGTTILSTKITIDNTEETSATATTAAVISDSALAADSEITIDIDQIGDGTAKGLKVTIIGHPA